MHWTHNEKKIDSIFIVPYIMYVCGGVALKESSMEINSSAIKTNSGRNL